MRRHLPISHTAPIRPLHGPGFRPFRMRIPACVSSAGSTQGTRRESMVSPTGYRHNRNPLQSMKSPNGARPRCHRTRWLRGMRIPCRAGKPAAAPHTTVLPTVYARTATDRSFPGTKVDRSATGPRRPDIHAAPGPRKRNQDGGAGATFRDDPSATRKPERLSWRRPWILSTERLPGNGRRSRRPPPMSPRRHGIADVDRQRLWPLPDGERPQSSCRLRRRSGSFRTPPSSGRRSCWPTASRKSHP